MTLKKCVSLIATYGLALLCLASASSPAFAAATCKLNTANRTVTICTPSNGATVNTTFHINAGSTDTTAPVTYMQVYVNGVAKLTQNRNFIDADLTLPAGSNQRFTVQAHDSAGVLFKTVYYINVGPGATCKLNTVNRTVTICTPSNGATVNTTFHVNAGSTDTTAPVTYMQVYVNGVAKLTQNRNFIDADLTLPAGSNQRFTVQAHDSAGVLFKTVYYINVGATASVVVTPNSATVQADATARFTATVTNDPANKGVNWTVSCPAPPCGTVSPTATASGGTVTYRAPATPPAFVFSATVTATSVSNASAFATATVNVPEIIVSVTNGPTTVLAGGTTQFTATVINDPPNKGVNWAVSCSAAPCGKISPSATASGVSTTYTAPATPPASDLSVTITVTCVDNPAEYEIVTLTVPAIKVSATPSGALLPLNTTQQFTATIKNDPNTQGVTWALTQGGTVCSPACGAISATSSASGTPITYTAPAKVPTSPSVTLTAISMTDTTKSAGTTITISSGTVKLVPNILGFGRVVVKSSSSPQTTTLTNTGNSTLGVTGIAIAGTNPGDFSETNNCHTSMVAGQSCDIAVTFKPTALGSRSAIVSITDNSPGSPQQVNLSGIGYTRGDGLKGLAVRAALAQKSMAAVPIPQGPDKVGTRVLDLVDSVRNDPYLASGAKRELPVRFWYPASLTEDCKLAEYTPPKVWNYFSRLAGILLPEVVTNSCSDAPISEGAHPVVVFTPGYTATFTDYTFIFEDLASRGYVVASVDHTYEATAVELPGGRLAASVFGSHLGGKLRGDDQSLSFATSVRLEDLKFVVNELQRLNVQANSPFAGKLDVSRIAVAGHSMGGAAAFLALEQQSHFRAGIIIDGNVPDALIHATRTPVLILGMGRERWSDDECHLWGSLRGPRLAVNLQGAEHVTPSDAVWLASGAIKAGDMGPDKTIAAVRDYIAAFLDTNLRGKPSGALLTGSSADYPDAAVTTQEQQLCGEAFDDH